jgi:hypothetical protein
LLIGLCFILFSFLQENKSISNTIHNDVLMALFFLQSKKKSRFMQSALLLLWIWRWGLS